MPHLSARLLFCAMIGLAAATMPARAEPPRTPCDGSPSPAPAPVGAPPAMQTWTPAELGPDWQPPQCSGWRQKGFRTLLALSGRFVLAGGADAVLARFGSASGMVGTRYWSVSGGRWETLILAADALDGAGSTRQRADFSARELAGGGAFYLRQVDNDSGAVRYRMQVLQATPRRIVVGIENASTIRRFFLALFSPGELQSLYVLDAEPGNVWRFYVLSRTATGASVLTEGHEASFINRAVAFYRYIAGIPTAQDPPAVR